jgi:hypothetical protein
MADIDHSIEVWKQSAQQLVNSWVELQRVDQQVRNLMHQAGQPLPSVPVEMAEMPDLIGYLQSCVAHLDRVLA